MRDDHRTASSERGGPVRGTAMNEFEGSNTRRTAQDQTADFRRAHVRADTDRAHGSVRSGACSRRLSVSRTDSARLRAAQLHPSLARNIAVFGHADDLVAGREMADGQRRHAPADAVDGDACAVGVRRDDESRVSDHHRRGTGLSTLASPTRPDVPVPGDGDGRRRRCPRERCGTSCGRPAMMYAPITPARTMVTAAARVRDRQQAQERGPRATTEAPSRELRSTLTSQPAGAAQSGEARSPAALVEAVAESGRRAAQPRRQTFD